MEDEQVGPLRKRWNACRTLMRRPSTYPFCILASINLWLNADQNLISPNLSQIANEFNLTAIEKDVIIGGQANLAFVLVGLFTSLIVGYFTDRVCRRNLLAVVILIGEFGCFCTLFVTNVSGFLVTRAITGISIGGAGPLLTSMTADLYPPEERGRALAFTNILRIFGVIIGQTIASSLGPSMGFRAPFAIAAVPALLLAPILRFTTKEPIRGSQERAVIEAAGGEVSETFYKEQVSWAKLKVALQSKTVLLVFLQNIPGSLPFAVLFAFFPDFLVTDVGGISVGETAAVVFSFGIANVIGLIAGGPICDRLWKRKYELVPLYSGVTTIIGALPVYLLVNGPSQPIGFYAGILFPVGLVLSQAIIAMGLIFLNVTSPETRGSLAAIGTIFSDIGSGIGAISVSGLVVLTGSRRSAFSIAVTFWFVCAALMLAMTYFIRKDYAKTQLLLEDAMRNAGAIVPDAESSPAETKHVAGKNSISSDETSTGSFQHQKRDPTVGHLGPEAPTFASSNPLFNARS